MSAYDRNGALRTRYGGGGGGSRLYSPSGLRKAAVDFWSPAALAKQVWLDADDPASITLTGGVVSQWTDKSGNGNHATQGTAANRPAVSAGAIAGRPALLFDGSNDSLTFASALLSTTFSLFVVFKPTIESVSGGLLTQYTNVGTPAGRTAIQTNQDSAGSTAAGVLNPFNSTVTSGAGSGGFLAGVPIANTAQMHSWLATTGAENCRYFRYGALFDAGTFTTMYTGVNTQLGVATGLSNYDGLFAELLLFTTVVSAAVQQQVEGYLAYKWGMQTQLAPGHLYSVEPPYKT